jgi:hypothetical protein
MTTEGTYELHWQRREYGQLTIQLYSRDELGQLRLVDCDEQGPFDSASETLRFIWRRLLLDLNASTG